MTSIVQLLVSWVDRNSTALATHGVLLTTGFPEPHSPSPWKAGIGLVYKGVIVSYTVWERTHYQTELIVVNAATKRTVLVDDEEPMDSSTINEDLDAIFINLLDETYGKMDPDPKLRDMA